MSLLVSIARTLLSRAAEKVTADFDRVSRDPRGTQHAFLFDLLRREQRSGFGQDHRFSAIDSLAEFRRRVPITRYEYFEPYIERVKNGETNALFHRDRVVMFAMTSGTTNTRKYIPVTERFAKSYRRAWQVWGVSAFRPRSEVFTGAKLVLASSYDEFRVGPGTPCGSMSGYSARCQNMFIRHNYVLPPEAANLHDTESKQYLAWRLGLGRDVKMWTSPNPSTHVSLARYGTTHAEQLIRDIRDGGVGDRNYPRSILTARRTFLAPNPQRSRELEKIYSQTGSLHPKDVWPNLKFIACWLGGTLGVYLRQFPEYFGEVAIRDIGLIASESRMTIPLMDGTPSGPLDLQGVFFEFIPIDEIDSPKPTVLEAHELQEGKEYYILLTTLSGLYRYNIQDVVRCTGWYHRTPCVEFLSKGANFSSLTGEKLTEFQVAQAVSVAVDLHDLHLNGFTLAPCWDEATPYYGLFIEAGDVPTEPQREALAATVDTMLRDVNCEYDSKRDSNRLDPIRVYQIAPGGWERWDRHRLQERGGTPEQYKRPCLLGALEFRQKIEQIAGGTLTPPVIPGGVTSESIPQ